MASRIRLAPRMTPPLEPASRAVMPVGDDVQREQLHERHHEPARLPDDQAVAGVITRRRGGGVFLRLICFRLGRLDAENRVNPNAGDEDHNRLEQRVESPVIRQYGGDQVWHVRVANGVLDVVGRHGGVDRRVGIAPNREIRQGGQQEHPGERHHPPDKQLECHPPGPASHGGAGVVNGGHNEHRADSRADGRLRERHVHRPHSGPD